MADLQILKRGLLVESSGPCVCVVAPSQLEIGSNYQLVLQSQAVEIVPQPPTQTIEVGDDYIMTP